MGEHRGDGGSSAAGPSPEAVLHAVVEMSDEAIVTLDAGGAVASWSSTAERLTGTRGADVVGQAFASLLSGHLQPAFRSVLARVGGGEAIKHFESELVRSDGMPIPIWLSIRAVAGPSPAAPVVVVVRDVTEQHLAQAALAEVESRLREGEALSHVGSWLWDVRTGVVQWSIEFHRIHGVDPFDFDGTLESHLRWVHSDDRDGLRAAMQRAVGDSRPIECEYRIVSPNGLTRTLRVRAQPTMGSAGSAVGLRGIGQDVTDHAAAWAGYA